jgi:hypothetical protein
MTKMKLKDGCPGCNRRWDAPRAEGQCSTCKRCLVCHEDADIPYTCAYKRRMRAARDPGYKHRSAIAYDRWMNQGSPVIGKY